MTRIDPPPVGRPPEPEPFTAAPVEEDVVDVLDPAQKSLADALRLSFALLKGLMIVVLIGYALSGIFRVQEGERAVLLRFGRIVGEENRQVRGPGWHPGLPFPMGEVVRVPVAPQDLVVNQAFWYETTERDVGKTTAERVGSAGPLNPLKDGSLLTGDANIVHARFNVSYAVTDPVAYVRNVGDQDLARRLVRAAVERGIVHAVAQVQADELIDGRANVQAARIRSQAVLDDLDCGITISTFAAGQTAMPLSVFGAYQQVSNAESEKASLIDRARSNYAEVLGQAAGEGYPALYELIQEFEAATAREDAARAGSLAAELDRAIADLRMPDARGGRPIGGGVAQLISRARTRSTEIEQTVKREAESFQSVLKEYRESPRLFLHDRWQQAREQIFSGDVETKYLPRDRVIRLDIDPDPELQRKRERDRFKAAEESARKQGGDR